MRIKYLTTNNIDTFLLRLLLYLTQVCNYSSVKGQSAARNTMTSSLEAPPNLNITSNQNASFCPALCFCNALNRIVYCSRRGLTQIPVHVPSDTLQLNLNTNPFINPHLSRTNFTSLMKLEHLYLSDCHIESIGVQTFIDLTRLKWLDISNNRISSIRPLTFSGSSLQHLFLNANRNLRLDRESFLGLQTTGLYLHDCAITELPPSVLLPLNNTLKYLWLNSNELTTLDNPLLSLFQSLSHLSLGSNPLHCGCSFSWMKELFDSSPEIFKGAASPSCISPPALRGKSFEEIRGGEFQCHAPMFTNIDTDFSEERVRLKCSANADPVPDIQWILPSGKVFHFPSDRSVRSDLEDETNFNENDKTFHLSFSDLENEHSSNAEKLPSPSSSSSSSSSSSTPSLLSFTNTATLELSRNYFDGLMDKEIWKLPEEENLYDGNSQYVLSRSHGRNGEADREIEGRKRGKHRGSGNFQRRKSFRTSTLPYSDNNQFNENENMASNNVMGIYVCQAINRIGNVTLTVNITWPPTSNHKSGGISTTNQETANGESQLVDDSEYERDEYPISSKSGNTNDSLIKTGNGNMAGKNKNNNYNVISAADDDVVLEDISRRFSATEMVCAVIGSHVGTLLLCLVAVPFYCRSRRHQRKKEHLKKALERQHSAAAAIAAANEQLMKVKDVQRSSTRSSTLQRPEEMYSYTNDGLGALSPGQFYVSDYLIAPHRTLPRTNPSQR